MFFINLTDRPLRSYAMFQGIIRGLENTKYIQNLALSPVLEKANHYTAMPQCHVLANPFKLFPHFFYFLKNIYLVAQGLSCGRRAP